MNNMGTVYPAQIDNSTTLPSIVDKVSIVQGSSVNLLRDAIVAIEAELGAKPSGTYSTVRNRLDYLEGLFADFNNETLSVALTGDLSGTFQNTVVVGLRGKPISSVAPTPGQILEWNGYEWAPTSTPGVAVGTAGQFLLTNAAGTSSVWVNLTGDVVSSATTPGQTTVYSLTGNSGAVTIPSGSRLVGSSNINLYVGTTQVAFLNVANTDFIAFGPSPASAGNIRISNTNSIEARNQSNSGDVQLIHTDTNNFSYFGDPGYVSFFDASSSGWVARVNGSYVLTFDGTNATFFSPNIAFAATTASPKIEQITPTSDVATNNLTISPQAPYASATTHKTPGSLIVNLPAPLSGGSEAYLQISRGGAEQIAIGYNPHSGVGSIWGTVTPGNSNFMLSGGGVVTYVNGPSDLELQVNSVSVGSFQQTSTDFIALGANPAASGIIRLANNSFIKARNAANSADLNIVRVDGSNELSLGDSTNSNNVYNTGSQHYFQIAGANLIHVGGSSFSFTNSTNSPTINHDAQSSDVATTTFSILSQNAYSGAVTNKNAGTLYIDTGAPASGGTAQINFGTSYATSIQIGKTGANVSIGQATGTGSTTIHGDPLYLYGYNGSGSIYMYGSSIDFDLSGVQNIWNASGLQFFSATPAFGGGTNIIGIANATTIPTSSVSTTGIALFSESGWFGINANGITFSSFLTGPTITQDQVPGTGTTATASLTIQAQKGQNVASGTNNNGGTLVLAGGLAGTGGTGGNSGSVNINSGSTNLVSFSLGTGQTNITTNGLTEWSTTNGTFIMNAGGGAFEVMAGSSEVMYLASGSSDYISLGSSTVASKGFIRFPSGGTSTYAIYARNAANTADVSILGLNQGGEGTDDWVVIGDSTNSTGTIVAAKQAGTIYFRCGSYQPIQVSYNAVYYNVPTLSFGQETLPTLTVNAIGGTVAGTTLIIRGQSQVGTGAAGATAIISGYSASGTPQGSVRIGVAEVSTTVAQTYIETANLNETAATGRVIALFGFGDPTATGGPLVTTTQVPSGDGVMWVGNAATNPSSNPTGGAILYASGGNLWVYPSSGSAFELQSGSSTFTPGGDLTGNATAQYVQSISGANDGGGTVALNVAILQFAASQSNPTISQAANTTGAGQAITIQAQAAKVGSGTYGGSVFIKSNTGDLAYGNVTIDVGNGLGYFSDAGTAFAGFTNSGGATLSFYQNSTIRTTSGTLTLNGTAGLIGQVNGTQYYSITGATGDFISLGPIASYLKISPTEIQITPATTDVATQSITVLTQSAYASATTNKSAGTLYLDTGTNVSGGTSIINIGTSNASQVTVGHYTATGNTVVAGANVQLSNSGYTITFTGLTLYPNGLVALGNTSDPFGSIALGSSPAQSGFIRLANNSQINFRNAANSADLPLIYNDGANNVYLAGSNSIPGVYIAVATNVTWTIGGTQVGDLNSTGISFRSGITNPTITQAQPTGTGTTAGTSINITAQQGQNVASGTNNNGGNIVLTSGMPGTGGTGGTVGDIEFYTGTYQVGAIYTYVGNTGQGCLWLGPYGTKSTSNYVLQSDGTTFVSINSPGASGLFGIDINGSQIGTMDGSTVALLGSGGFNIKGANNKNVGLLAQGTGQLTMVSSSNVYIGTGGNFLIYTYPSTSLMVEVSATGTILWGATMLPYFEQNQVTGTGTTAGVNFTIQAQQGQNQTGATNNNNGGNIILKSGAPGTGGTGSAGRYGQIQLQASASTDLSVYNDGNTHWQASGTTTLYITNSSQTTAFQCNLLSLNPVAEIDLYINSSQIGKFTEASTDFLALGASAAQSGMLRLANTAAIKARNQANSADVLLISTDTSNNVSVGDATNGGGVYAYAKAGAVVSLNVGSAGMGFYDTAGLRIDAPSSPHIYFTRDCSNAEIYFEAQSTDTATTSIYLKGQDCLATATTNTTGGNIILLAGAGATSNTNYKSGNVIAYVNGFAGTGSESFFQVQKLGTNMVQMGHWPTAGTGAGAIFVGNVTPASGNYSLASDGSATHVNGVGNYLYFESNGSGQAVMTNSGWQFNSVTPSFGGGSGVISIGNRNTAPTSVPGSGVVLYSEGGGLIVDGNGGVLFSPIVGFPSFGQQTGTGAGATMTISAQNAGSASTNGGTFYVAAGSAYQGGSATGNGGTLWLQSGGNASGTGSDGSINLGLGGSSYYVSLDGSVGAYGTLAWSNNFTGPIITQTAPSTDAQAVNFTIQAQSAMTGAVNFKNGGSLVLEGGNAASGGNNGSVNFAISGTTYAYFGGGTSNPGFYPQTDLTGYLGGSSSRWSNAYIDTTWVNTTVVPMTDGGATLGSVARKWSFIYTDTLYAYTALLPGSDLGANLGTSAARWDQLFVSQYQFLASYGSQSGVANVCIHQVANTSTTTNSTPTACWSYNFASGGSVGAHHGAVFTFRFTARIVNAGTTSYAVDSVNGGEYRVTCAYNGTNIITSSGSTGVQSGNVWLDNSAFVMTFTTSGSAITANVEYANSTGGPTVYWLVYVEAEFN